MQVVSLVGAQKASLHPDDMLAFILRDTEWGKKEKKKGKIRKQCLSKLNK